MQAQVPLLRGAYRSLHQLLHLDLRLASTLGLHPCYITRHTISLACMSRRAASRVPNVHLYVACAISGASIRQLVEFYRAIAMMRNKDLVQATSHEGAGTGKCAAHGSARILRKRRCTCLGHIFNFPIRRLIQLVACVCIESVVSKRCSLRYPGWVSSRLPSAVRLRTWSASPARTT